MFSFPPFVRLSYTKLTHRCKLIQPEASVPTNVVYSRQRFSSQHSFEMKMQRQTLHATLVKPVKVQHLERTQKVFRVLLRRHKEFRVTDLSGNKKGDLNLIINNTALTHTRKKEKLLKKLNRSIETNRQETAAILKRSSCAAGQNLSILEKAAANATTGRSRESLSKPGSR